MKIFKSEKVYEGKIIDVYSDKLALKDGEIVYRDVVRHRHASAIVAIDHKEHVLVVRQYRYPIGKELIEIPAGLIDEGESPIEAAKRELREETGYIANDWSMLTEYYTSAGCNDEKISIFLARDIKKVGRQKLDKGEILSYTKLPFKELYNMVVTGNIKDGKTIIGTFLTKRIAKDVK